MAALLLVILYFTVWTPFTSEDELARGGGVAAIAVISFVVFFQSDSGVEDRSQALRRALAGGTVLTFLVVFALTFFHDSGDRSAADATIRSELLTDFRWVVISVVGFYFGTDAVHRYLSMRFGSGGVEAEA